LALLVRTTLLLQAACEDAHIPRMLSFLFPQVVAYNLTFPRDDQGNMDKDAFAHW
jgi:hypothetical protein